MNPGQSDIVIRRLAQADLASALVLQAASYPAFLLEDAEAFASRLAVPAEYCLAAVRGDVQGDVLIGYLLAHGWASAAPPPVGTVLKRNVVSEILYIHDLAVSSAAKGLGVGRKLIDRAFDSAARDGLARAELIAVEGAARYWSGLGFDEGTPSPALAAKVAGYGESARWMTRFIPSPRQKPEPVKIA